jgi:hypothetical protein
MFLREETVREQIRNVNDRKALAAGGKSAAGFLSSRIIPLRRDA